MAQAASGEDTISERLTQRKKKKKKTKKHTLRSSEWVCDVDITHCRVGECVKEEGKNNQI